MPVIDVIDALGLLDECLRDQAAGRYTPEEAEAAGALLAAVVSRAPAGTPALLQMPLTPESWAEDVVAKRETLSIGALIALRAADRTQRAGACWACAVVAARRCVVAYVDLLPERLWQEAADERRRRVPARASDGRSIASHRTPKDHGHLASATTESRHRCSGLQRMDAERCRGARARGS